MQLVIQIPSKRKMISLYSHQRDPLIVVLIIMQSNWMKSKNSLSHGKIVLIFLIMAITDSHSSALSSKMMGLNVVKKYAAVSVMTG